VAATTPTRTIDPDAPVTRRALGVELLGPMAGSAFLQPPVLVRRRDGQTLSVTPLLAAVLEALDGERTHLEVAWEVARTTDRVLSADEVGYLIDEKLRPLGLVVDGDAAEPDVERSHPLLALRLRFVVTNPRVTSAVTRPFAALFRPWIVALVLLAFAAVSGWVLFGKGVGSGLHDAFYEPRLLLLVVALTILSAGFHEFGHAAACRYGGATPGAMGAAIYLVWPAFYTDVSDSYRLDRRGRLRVDLGGLYFNAIFAVATFATWWFVRWDALLLVVPLQLFQMVRQLLPLVRFDGYHILADLTGVPDLFARIRPTLAGLLPGRWGDPECRVLKPWARLVVTAWVLVVVPALLLFLVVMVLGLPRLFATAADSLRLQHAALSEAFTEGDGLAALARLVSIFAIALTPLSIAYLLGRLGRRVSTRAWQVAGSVPYGRPVLAVGFAGLAAIAAIALWPGDQYQPVRPGERLALGDGFGLRHSPIVALTGEVADRLELRSAGAVHRKSAGSSGSAGTPDDGPRSLRLPPGETAAEVELVSTPASALPAAGRSAWPFPFAPPPAPRAHDNFAVAVSTVDGDRVAVMETSMAWLGEARVDHRNRAYALASCADCTTVAAAFQVVVASGTSRTVVPENSAIAVNYQCTTCITHAIAVQTVVTTTSTPPAEVRARVEAQVRAARALEARVASIPPAELRSRLRAIEAEILEVLGPYTKEVAGGEATDEAAPAPVTTGDTGEPSTSSPSTTTTSAPPASTSTTEAGAASPSSSTSSSSTSSTTAAPSTSTTTSTSTSTTTPTTSTTTPEATPEEPSPDG
jgi:putative peptide zinc metalloprotease protein